MIYRSINAPEVRAATRELLLQARTIREVQFLNSMVTDTAYSEGEGRSVFIGVGYKESQTVSIAVAKAQNRKRGVWGRYSTLTYAFTDRAHRQQGHAKLVCRGVLSEACADRVKSLAASRQGLALHRSLGHQFWGVNSEGKVIVDSPSFAADLPGMPPQVKLAGGTGLLDYDAALTVFRDHNSFGYNYRDDPEDYLLNGAEPGLYGYEHISPKDLLAIRADTKAGEMLRWENRKGTYIKKPSEGELSELICFRDSTLPYPWAFAGYRNGALVYRVTVSRKGERRHAG